MRVNRLGKIILESYSGLKEFIAKNDLKVNFRTLYGWCTEYSSTPNLKNYIHIDAIAKVLGANRQDILDMIATKAVFDIEPKKEEKPKKVEPKKGRGMYKRVADNLLKQKRMELGFMQKELAELIGLDNKQILVDIENGKRTNFPNSEILKNYLEALDISFTQFQNEINALRKKEKARDTERNEEKRNAFIDKIYGGYDEEAIEKRDKVMEEFNNEYEVDYTGTEAVIKPKEDVEVNPWVDIFKKTGESQKNPLLPAEDMQTVMSLIYGKVDFKTFKTIERILGGEQ